MAKTAKTFEFEDNLPSLPLPELNETLNMYLESLKPFLDSNEFTKVEIIVKKFENGIGKELQESLKQRAITKKNWVSESNHFCPYKPLI